MLGGRFLMKKTIPEALSILRGYSVLNKNEFIQIRRKSGEKHDFAPCSADLQPFTAYSYDATI